MKKFTLIGLVLLEKQWLTQNRNQMLEGYKLNCKRRLLKWVLLPVFYAFCQSAYSQYWTGIEKSQLDYLSATGGYNKKTIIAEDQGNYYGLFSGDVFRLDGTAWTKIASMPKIFLNYGSSLAVEGSSLVVSAENKIIISTNAGNSWVTQELPANIGHLQSIVLQNQRLYGIVSIGSNFYWVYSNDLGKTWVIKDQVDKQSMLYKSGGNYVGVSVDSYSGSSLSLRFITDTTLTTYFQSNTSYYYPIRASSDNKLYALTLDRNNFELIAGYYDLNTKTYVRKSRNLLNPLDEYPLDGTGIPFFLYADGNHIWLDWYSYTDLKRVLFLSTDGGSSFKKQNTNYGFNLDDCDYVNLKSSKSVLIKKNEVIGNYDYDHNLTVFSSTDKALSVSKTTGIYKARANLAWSDGKFIYFQAEGRQVYKLDPSSYAVSTVTNQYEQGYSFFSQQFKNNGAIIRNYQKIDETVPYQKELLYTTGSRPPSFITNLPCAETDLIEDLVVDGERAVLQNFTRSEFYLTDNGGLNWVAKSKNEFLPLELRSSSNYWLYYGQSKMLMVRQDSMWMNNSFTEFNWQFLGTTKNASRITQAYSIGDDFFVFDFDKNIIKIDVNGMLHDYSIFPDRYLYYLLISENIIYGIQYDSSYKGKTYLYKSSDLGLTWTKTSIDGLYYPRVHAFFKIGNKFYITTSNDGIMELDVNKVSVREITINPTEHFGLVYPNPAQNYFKLKRQDVLEVKVYNLNGQLVDTYHANEKQEFETSHLSNGMYLLKALTNKQEVLTDKLLIQRD